MQAFGMCRWLLPFLVAGSLAACDPHAVSPGIVQTSSSTPAAGPAPAAYAVAVPGERGRVVSIHEVALRGHGGGSGNGAFVGGLLGAAGGATLGGITSQTVGGGRGIEVTVQKDDGQPVVVAQRDDGDIQLGDRVHIVQDRNGVARVVRDTARQTD